MQFVTLKYDSYPVGTVCKVHIPGALFPPLVVVEILNGLELAALLAKSLHVRPYADSLGLEVFGTYPMTLVVHLLSTDVLVAAGDLSWWVECGVQLGIGP